LLSLFPAAIAGKALNQGWAFSSPVFQITFPSAASQHPRANGFSNIFET
jgi:hypothetical protein